MKINLKYKFLSDVQSLKGDEIMVITRIQVNAEGYVLYGCLRPNGETGWFNEYELKASDLSDAELGFLNISYQE